MPRTATARKTTTKPRPVAAPAQPGRFVQVGEQLIHEPARGLMWTRATLGRFNYADAQKQIEKLNAEKYAGHDDWRLPTVEELFCLADRSRSSPAIDTEAFPDTKSDWYWTGTPYAPLSGFAWFVSFGYGISNSVLHGHDGFVRAVRASQ
jgi:hypothetical protein